MGFGSFGNGFSLLLGSNWCCRMGDRFFLEGLESENLQKNFIFPVLSAFLFFREAKFVSFFF